MRHRYCFRWCITGVTYINAENIETAQDTFDCFSAAELANQVEELSHLEVSGGDTGHVPLSWDEFYRRSRTSQAARPFPVKKGA